jgi:hypothetical protein
LCKPDKAVDLLDRPIALLRIIKVYEEIASALDFDRKSVLPPKFAAFLPLDTFDAPDGNTITHVSAKGNRP